MNSYLCTITFLAIMGLLTSSEMIQHHNATFENQCYTQSRYLLAAAEEVAAMSNLEELRKAKKSQTGPRLPKEEKKSTTELNHSTSKYPKALGVNMARPPNNSRLNVFNLLHKQPHKNLPEEFCLYDVMVRLMYSLYNQEPFFEKAHDAPRRILDTIIAKKALTTHFTAPDQLSELDLEDEALQHIFCQMLKGTHSAPSLLNFITFDTIDSPQTQSRKINLLFADPRILYAIFPDGTTADQLITMREQLLETIEYQKLRKAQYDTSKGRRDYALELKQKLTDILLAGGFNAEKYASHVFDYSLGKAGTIMFIENSKTHIITREKYIPKTTPKK